MRLAVGTQSRRPRESSQGLGGRSRDQDRDGRLNRCSCGQRATASASGGGSETAADPPLPPYAARAASTVMAAPVRIMPRGVADDEPLVLQLALDAQALGVTGRTQRHSVQPLLDAEGAAGCHQRVVVREQGAMALGEGCLRRHRLDPCGDAPDVGGSLLQRRAGQPERWTRGTQAGDGAPPEPHERAGVQHQPQHEWRGDREHDELNDPRRDRLAPSCHAQTVPTMRDG